MNTHYSFTKKTATTVKPFYSIEEFPKFKILEYNYNTILEELKFVLKENSDNNNDCNHDVFEPWVEKNLYEESNEEGWDVAPLMIGGNIIEERCQKFPKLYELIKQINGIVSVSFSWLKPGTHIVPHKGYDEYSEKVLRFHMGLIIPKGDIGIRVDKEIKNWEEGKSFIFDDFLIHEAWNFSEKDRIVLIIDFLRENKTENVVFNDKNFNTSINTYLN